jgi:hypothetical protein
VSFGWRQGRLDGLGWRTTGYWGARNRYTVRGELDQGKIGDVQQDG